MADTANFSDSTYFVNNPCDPASGNVDTDNDGITDICDDDDDNDGILDSDEGCIECNGDVFLNGDFENGPFPNSYTQVSETVVDGWLTTAPDNKIEIWKTGFSSVPSQTGSYHVEINSSHSAALYQRVCTRPGAQISWSVWHRGRSGVDVAVVKIGDSLSTASIQATMTTGKTNWVQYSGTYNVPTNQIITYFIFEAVSTANGNSTVGNFIDNIQIQEIVSATCLDTDNDGIPDSKDLDSDGDGCFDVLESGGIDANNDGILDGTGTSSTGTVTGSVGGYNGLTGEEIIAHQITVSTVPTSQTVLGGNSVTFSVGATADFATSYNNGTPIYNTSGNANAGLQYQWYLGNPNTGGIALSDNTTYNGSNTATLTINNNTGLNNQEFCVLVTHTSNECNEEVRSATLSLTENCSNGVDDDGDGMSDCDDPECKPQTPAAIILD